MPPLYSINPSLRKRFMKKLTRERVVPIISASVSCEILGISVSCASAGLAKLRHQQQDARQPLLAGVEELIDQVGLGAHAARQQKPAGTGRRRALLLVHGAGSSPTRSILSAEQAVIAVAVAMRKPGGAGHRLLADKIAGGEAARWWLLCPRLRENGELGATALEEEDAIGRVALAKEGPPGLQLNGVSRQSNLGELLAGVKFRLVQIIHPTGFPSIESRAGAFSGFSETATLTDPAGVRAQARIHLQYLLNGRQETVLFCSLFIYKPLERFEAFEIPGTGRSERAARGAGPKWGGHASGHCSLP